MIIEDSVLDFRVETSSTDGETLERSFAIVDVGREVSVVVIISDPSSGAGPTVVASFSMEYSVVFITMEELSELFNVELSASRIGTVELNEIEAMADELLFVEMLKLFCTRELSPVSSTVWLPNIISSSGVT